MIRLRPDLGESRNCGETRPAATSGAGLEHMTSHNPIAVMTTVQPPTRYVRAMVKALGRHGMKLIVAGDARGPEAFVCGGSEFLSLAEQRRQFRLGRRLPTGHYSRKNVAYLAAIAQGAPCIFETDDDNAPLSCWTPRREWAEWVRVVSPSIAHKGEKEQWVNVYRYFSRERIWPRGLPLDAVRAAVPRARRSGSRLVLRAPIQQGLVNRMPDVDAIWRLVFGHPVEFGQSASVYLMPGNWCPFNTQNTWWWPDAYPLLYIPSLCSFRACDIWRSFVAQRCLWELGLGVVHHAPDVAQDRNPHDIASDLQGEVPVFTQARDFARVLSGVRLRAGVDEVGANLLRCYEALVAASLFPKGELGLVTTWLADLELARPSTHKEHPMSNKESPISKYA